MKKLTLVMSAALVGTVLSAGSALADCQSDALSVRSELEKAGAALQAAIKSKKSDPVALCPLFRNYTAAEQKWVKFLTDNKEWCQIPPQVVQEASAGNKKTAETRNRICDAAANGGAAGGPVKPPPQGSLSSALGITTGYSISPSTKGSTGVFDTLNGNALK
ncbi:hypothetical protein V5F59_13180 [Xanthobacter autotrophicus DSM 431]|uniref:hypothetical protein n=1 Tax=Xanthobacter nonsaccharivorans TaxID=3119912 RepID=UPI0037281072